PATLNVDDDVNPPNAVRAYSLSGTTIKVIFNEDLNPAIATDPGVYDSVNGSSVINAVLMADNAGVSNTVLLTLDTQLASSSFTVSGFTADNSTSPGPNGAAFAINGSVFALGQGLVDDGPVGTALDPLE